LRADQASILLLDPIRRLRIGEQRRGDQGQRMQIRMTGQSGGRWWRDQPDPTVLTRIVRHFADSREARLGTSAPDRK
jgi:hypothetical protein